MALSASGLAAAITAEQGPAPTPDGQAIQNEQNLKLATAIVNYIKANATVTGTTAVDGAPVPLTNGKVN